MRWIYLSPHLDDAVLSAGGLIYKQAQLGMDVQIWTFMSGFPPDTSLSRYARGMHREWGISTAAEVVHARRKEDRRAASIVGAKAVHFNYLDCIYRRGKNGKWLYSNIFVPPHQGDADLPTRIAKSISTRLKRDDQLVCQFGIGSHVDHILVRQAAESLGRKLYYLADVPYVLRKPRSLGAQTLGMKEAVQRVSAAGLRSWTEAAAAYVSQIEVLFQSRKKMFEKIHKYYKKSAGIRLWSLE